MQYLDRMKNDFGMCNDNGNSKDDDDDVDPTILESIIVCLVTISRGYVMLGDFDQGLERASEALQVIERLQSSMSTTHSSSSSFTNKKVVAGGKRAWKEDKKGGTNSNNITIAANCGDDARREESNKLFRSHRLSELRTEALALKHTCSKNSPEKTNIVTRDAKSFARLLMTRLFYFSGGGTTQALGSDGKQVEEKKDDNSLTYQRLTNSLWSSFGLKEIAHRVIDCEDEGGDLVNIFRLKPKKSVKQLPNFLDAEVCDRLRKQLVGLNCDTLSEDGCLNFNTIFYSDGKKQEGGSSLPPLHIELGSGSGDWVVTQSKLNPTENYVTVELRADRVAQTFFKCIAQNTLKNMCCVGSDCGSFLRERVSSSQCRTIFVNHPEPPTQTYDNESSDEPAHMLNSANIRLAANCLEKDGKGRLIIVTDNLIYAKFLCRTMTRVMADGILVGLHPSQVPDLRTVDSFIVENSRSSKLWLYEGKPSSSIGHFYGNAGNGADKGTSYFDRLWRTGAGKHADMKKRYIVALRTSGGADSFGHHREGSAATTSYKARKKKNNDGHAKKKEKKPKKRNAEAQKRRNERRLLKKQQQQQQQQQQAQQKEKDGD